MAEVVITGVGMVTPLGSCAREVLDRIRRGDTAAQRPAFADAFACPWFAPVLDFDAEQHFPDNKTLRLMNRDAQMAVVAARRALADAGIRPGESYLAEEIALYGATGLSGSSSEDLQRLIENAVGPDGKLDLERFGRVALKRIRPVLSFKILANMPICFVSIFENLRGPNAVYTPWEGSGAQAIAAGIRAIRSGQVPCAVAGACDVKTHALSFASLQQLGVFDSWTRCGNGPVPGEGAAFLVLENKDRAQQRNARILAQLGKYRLGSTVDDSSLSTVFASLLERYEVEDGMWLVAAGEGDPAFSRAEAETFQRVGVQPSELLHPKRHVGNLFAAAAALQVALAAELIARREGPRHVLAHCSGHGTEHGAFWVEGV